MIKFGVRIYSIILIITLLCGSVAFASEIDSDVKSDFMPFSSEEFDILNGLGFLSEDVLTMNANAPLTRAQFIGILFKIVGYDAQAYTKSNIPFIDVSFDNPYRKEISGFYNMGIVSGVGEKEFAPDAPITYLQAASLIVNVLGYKKYASMKFENTNYPYINMAIELDLISNMDAYNTDKAITADEAIKILYRTARTDIMEVTGIDGNGYATYQVRKDFELIEKYNDIHYREGVVYSDGMVAIANAVAQEEIAVIEGQRYEIRDFDVLGLLGYEVNFFFKTENDVNVLLYAFKSDSDSKNVVEIKSSDLDIDNPQYSLTNILYYKKDKLEKLKVSEHVEIIYNNSEDLFMNEIKPKSGSVRFISIDGDNKCYEYAVIEEYDNIFVSAIPDESELIFGKYGQFVNPRAYEKVKIYMDGKEIAISDIPLNRVISMLKSNDNSSLIMYVNKAGTLANLDKITKKNNKDYYGFGKESYCFANSYLDLMAAGLYSMPTVELGGQYTYYLDRDGNIAEISGEVAGLQYAYVIDAMEDDDDFADAGSVKIKLILENGTITVVKGIKNIKTNDQFFTSRVSITGDELVRDSRFKRDSVVKVLINSKNEIKEFYFANGENQGYALDSNGEPFRYGYNPDISSFTRNYTATNSTKVTYKSTGKYLEIGGVGKYFLTPATKCFVKYLNTLGDDPEYAVVVPTSYLSNEGTYKAELYDVNSALEVSVMSYAGYRYGVAKNSMMIVDEVSRVLYNDEPRMQITGFVNAKKVTYIEKEDGIVEKELRSNVRTLKRGDVIGVSVSGNILQGIKFLRRLSDRPESVESDATWDGDLTVEKPKYEGRLFSRVYSTSENNMVCYTPHEMKVKSADTTNANSTYISKLNNGELMSMSFAETYYSMNIMLYDMKTDTVYVGDMADITQLRGPKSDGTLPDDGQDVWAYVYITDAMVRQIILVYY